jgi:putative transposase
MARQLRLEFPGAICHVTARGNARAAIFLDDEDRDTFLAVLAECVARFGWLCHAYCLMDNHYHLLIETPHANLLAGMRQLNGVYTQRVNRCHGRVGHVFQGRFKAILVERDSYLLELCRYVVLNPVRAKMVDEAGQYGWSSYLATRVGTAAPHWLQTDWVLSQFGKSRTVARRKYGAFVAEGVGKSAPWSELKGQVLLGREPFVSDLQPLLVGKSELKEFPQAQRLMTRPALKSLFPATVKASKTLREEAICKACLECGYSMADIARQAEVHYSTVSRVIKGER